MELNGCLCVLGRNMRWRIGDDIHAHHLLEMNEAKIIELLGFAPLWINSGDLEIMGARKKCVSSSWGCLIPAWRPLAAITGLGKCARRPAAVVALFLRGELYLTPQATWGPIMLLSTSD